MNKREELFVLKSELSAAHQRHMKVKKDGQKLFGKRPSLNTTVSANRAYVEAEQAYMHALFAALRRSGVNPLNIMESDPYTDEVQDMQILIGSKVRLVRAMRHGAEIRFWFEPGVLDENGRVRESIRYKTKAKATA